MLRRLAQPSPTQGTSLRRVQLTAKDEEVLEYLADVAVEDLEPEVDEDGDEMGGFKLSFTFAPNPYFDNETLVRPQLLPGVRRACEIFRGANFLSRTCGGRQGPVGRMCVLCVLPLCQHLSGAPTLADTHGVHPADKDVLHLRGGRRAHAEPRGGHPTSPGRPARTSPSRCEVLIRQPLLLIVRVCPTLRGGHMHRLEGRQERPSRCV